MNLSIFKNKSVLITGHTGFKGSWLTTWLALNGAKITGFSNEVPTHPSHFDLIKGYIKKDIIGDIKDPKAIYECIKQVKPDFIFHLAAQPIVLKAYEEPLLTFTTNTIGTANLLDSLRRLNNDCISIMITSDKSYYNQDWAYGYRETDKLGDIDPYGGSKGAAEIIINSYVESFFKSSNSKVLIAIGRAGNVIGGGDWAENRIIPDFVRKWANKEVLEVRNPSTIRPWQPVLEPLSGYLELAINLNNSKKLNGEAFNFGPSTYQNYNVEYLVNGMKTYLKNSNWIKKSKDHNASPESAVLKLNCDKALEILNWKSILSMDETIQMTSEWYRTYYEKGVKAAKKQSVDQINSYELFLNKRR